jgi:hypothetical protein
MLSAKLFLNPTLTHVLQILVSAMTVEKLFTKQIIPANTSTNRNMIFMQLILPEIKFNLLMKPDRRLRPNIHLTAD